MPWTLLPIMKFPFKFQLLRYSESVVTCITKTKCIMYELVIYTKFEIAMMVGYLHHNYFNITLFSVLGSW